MNRLTIVVAAAIALPVMAEPNKAPSATELAARKAAQREADYREFGGWVKRPNTQEGRIAFVNAQERADEAVIRESAENFEDEFHFQIDVERGAFSIAAPKVSGNATLFVIDDAALPMLLAAPEDRWAAVNVAKLAAGADRERLNARLSKELSRGFALLGGAFLSQFNRTLTECMTDAKALDEYPDWRLPFDALQKMRTYLKGYGLKPYEPVCYRDACYEGWAPPPKDEIQKAIMDEENAARIKDNAAKK